MKKLLEAGADVTTTGGDKLFNLLYCKHCSRPPPGKSPSGHCQPCVQKFALIQMLLDAGVKVEDRHVIRAAKGYPKITHTGTGITYEDDCESLEFL